MASAGVDFRSDKLWESYIAWEEENDHLQNVMNIYDRLLTVPTQLYSHNFDWYVLRGYIFMYGLKWQLYRVVV